MRENRSYSSGNPETIAVPREYYEQLKARVERLEAALRFYADLNNYRKDDLGYTKVGFDLGDIARSALELESEK